MRFWFLACLTLVTASTSAAPFQGWAEMRIIQQDGAPERMIAADLGGDGREELIVVNARQTRLDIYRWLPKGERKPAAAADPDRPNELPLAPDWVRGELALDEVPLDVIAHDLDGDRLSELLVLTSPSHKVVAYQKQKGATSDSATAWKRFLSWDLLTSGLSGQQRNFMLLRWRGGDKHELLVSCEQGIQQLALEKSARPTWLSPRESRGRLDWRLADLDGDADEDLIEWSSQARQAIRWYECDAQHKLLPAQTLHELGVEGFDVLRRRGASGELLLLGGTQVGLVRRYQLTRGETGELGRYDALPMSAGPKAAWCGMQLDQQRAIVALDTAQPRLRVHTLNEQGWGPEQTFPTLGGVRALAAPVALSGTLLLWIKDAADLQRCRWEHGRLSYPQPSPQSADVADRRILALDTIGSTVWWVQRVGAHLDLYVWRKEDKQPQLRRFADVGAKSDKVVWLGDDRLLVQQAYSTATKLVRWHAEKASISEPAHLAKADLGEFVLVSEGPKLRSARLTEGVLQWLGDDLHATDQIMLGDGQKLASYVPLDQGEAWALEQGGAFIHRLKPDASGVARVVDSLKPPQGSALRVDPVLGVLLIDQDRLLRLSRGAPWELKLIDSLDGRAGRPSGLRENTIHHLFALDVLGDATDEVVLADYRRHQLTLVERTADGLTSLASWPVFDDSKYPYGDEAGPRLVEEPRRVISFNADGDAVRDVAMLCHDRLLIYVAREP